MLGPLVYLAMTIPAFTLVYRWMARDAYNSRFTGIPTPKTAVPKTAVTINTDHGGRV